MVDGTIAYVVKPIVNVSTLYGLSSFTEPPCPSESTAMMVVGSLTSII